MDKQANESIPGLKEIPNILTKQEEQALIKSILQKPWNNALKRRTQHYGYEYGYDRKSVATKTVEIPEEFLQVKQKLQKQINGKL